MLDDGFWPEDVEAAKELARNLTRARIKALAVLDVRCTARYSNATSSIKGTVYWQSADWLSQQGLVRIGDPPRHARDMRQVVTLTDLGRWVYRRRLDGPL